MESTPLTIVAQAGIAAFGCSAIWLVGHKKSNIRRWGYVTGLCAQPFWIYTAISNKQWGILLLSIWYGYAWGQGFYNYWIKPGEADVRQT